MHLRHQHDVARGIDVAEGGKIVCELVTEHEAQARHGAAFARRPRLSSPLQRSEQVFTSSQTRSHFLRQAKGRPQASQVFCGRSPFARIFATA
jgi:hypothetical protein